MSAKSLFANVNVAAFIWWNAMYLLIIFAFFFNLAMSWYSRVYAALFLVYIASIFVSRPEYRPHKKFYSFAKYFPSLVAMRKHIQMSIAPLPKSLIEVSNCRQEFVILGPWSLMFFFVSCMCVCVYVYLLYVYLCM